MSIQIATNRFIVPPKVKSDGLYQQLLKGVLNYEQLGNRLIHLSERAHTFRQFDILSEYALILSKLPSEKYQTVGQYYLSLVLCRNGLGEMDNAQTILEKVASVAPLNYRARALLSLSAISWVKKQPDDTLKYCIEATKIERFDLTGIQALRGIAVLKGREGFHRSSLRDLENLYPIMKHTPAHIYLDYLNSLAVELAECDRLEEAKNISKITCSSPLVIVYPEWRETGQDLALRGYKSRSSVRVKELPKNIAYLPEPSPATDTSIQSEAARVLSMGEWKKKMGKNGEDKIDTQKMGERELLLKIIELSSKESTTESDLRQILDAIVKITSKG